MQKEVRRTATCPCLRIAIRMHRDAPRWVAVRELQRLVTLAVRSRAWLCASEVCVAWGLVSAVGALAVR